MLNRLSRTIWTLRGSQIKVSLHHFTDLESDLLMKKELTIHSSTLRYLLRFSNALPESNELLYRTHAPPFVIAEFFAYNSLSNRLRQTRQ